MYKWHGLLQEACTSAGTIIIRVLFKGTTVGVYDKGTIIIAIPVRCRNKGNSEGARIRLLGSRRRGLCSSAGLRFVLGFL